MDSLIARLESATEGSRELSDEVLRACGFVDVTLEWPEGEGRGWHHGSVPPILHDADPTVSADDALALLDPAEGWTISNLESGFDMTSDSAYGCGATLPLTICIVALRAKGLPHG